MKLVTRIALAAAVLLAAGCGTSGPSNSSFAAKADAICASLSAADAKLSPSGDVAALKSQEANLAVALTKLQGLSAPYDRGGPYSAFIYELGQVRALLPRLATATAAHDTASIGSLEAGVRGFERNAESSEVEAGLKGCR